MTGPEQHAATVRAALTAIDFRLSTTHSTQSANAALAARAWLAKDAALAGVQADSKDSA